MAYESVGLIHATIDSRIRLAKAQLPKDLIAALRAAFTHANPDFHKKRAMGYSLHGVDSSIKTWRETETTLELPRGGTSRLRAIASDLGHSIKFIDQRVSFPPVAWPDPADDFELRPYQSEALLACLSRQQGIIRAPTGSGKTSIALAVAAALQQPALVIMRDSNLLSQWKERAVSQLGLSPREIGELRGSGRHRVGQRLTLALQQTLYSKKFPLESVANEFGTVIVDEVQGVAASTFMKVIDVFPAKHRIGVSADESRRDKREFLIYDQFGEIIYEIERHELEKSGTIHRVMVRLIPTDFRADWYRDAASGERDFGRLLDEITTDEARNEQLIDALADITKREAPVFIFTHRIEHARWIADVGMFSRKISCGLMLGGADNQSRFNEDKARLNAGTLTAAAGTYSAIGTGIDAPRVQAGLMATPIGNNAQFFGQVRGRICRPAKGKTGATLYVAWDRHVFPEAPKRYAQWNNGLVQIWDADQDVWRDATRR